eukprot:7390638-Prymnesium_polylepis.1
MDAQLMRSSFSALREGGCTVAELKAEDFLVNQLKAAGFTSREVYTAGYVRCRDSNCGCRIHIR